MNRIIVSFMFSFLIGSIALEAQELAIKNNTAITKISWDKTEIDLGVLKQNNPAEVIYSFTNTGENPLIIKGVRTSCGCTATKYAKEPIMPGKSSDIVVSYNARAIGKFRKSITVTSNTENQTSLLIISGEVK